MQIDKKIRLLRAREKITQEELVKELGLSPNVVSRWENGLSIPSTQSLNKLATFFKVSLDDLVNGDLTVTVKK